MSFFAKLRELINILLSIRTANRLDISHRSLNERKRQLLIEMDNIRFNPKDIRSISSREERRHTMCMYSVYILIDDENEREYLLDKIEATNAVKRSLNFDFEF